MTLPFDMPPVAAVYVNVIVLVWPAETAPVPLVSVPDHGPPGPGARVGALTISPNPFRSTVRISAPVPASDVPNEHATLVIADVTGRVVRRIAGDPRSGFAWDGRDAAGHVLPAGIYLHRLVTSRGIWHGTSCLLR